MGARLYFDNYSPAGDLVVVTVCMTIIVLLATSYVKKTKVFGVYLGILGCLMAAALCNVTYHQLYTRVTDGDYSVIYAMRIVFHGLLFSNLLLYVVYVNEVMRLEKDKRAPIMISAVLIYATVIAVDVITAIRGTGFKLDASGVKVSGKNIFLYGYLAFVALIVTMLIVFRNRVYKRVMLGFYGTITVSFFVLYVQGRYGQSSFTVTSFLFPVLAMLYLIHANPYDIELGSINIKALEDWVRYNYKRGQEFLFMSMYMPDFDGEGKDFPEEIQKEIRRFATVFFKDATLFQVSNGLMILMARKSKNPNYRETGKKILDAFYKAYDKYQYDYKIVMGTSVDEISKKNEYVSFIQSIHQKMNINDIHVVKLGDEEAFKEYEYILTELADISAKKDLDDPRVLAYCQPVFNLSTKKYDTAEALMRLTLPKLGIVYPNQFIPIAENNGYIHSLTLIILNKTCKEIRNLMDGGYEVKRISVNVSALELRDLVFTEDITRIIRDANIPADKVALEITESQTDKDFLVLKSRINELKDRGIKFYLDDFGTGYSNMERILELPFDIIKFDRSLVMASDANERSEKMVGSLAGMFADLQYSVLYEGVETKEDENRCSSMSANYLQGFKYSRPVPIAELKQFFTKVG